MATRARACPERTDRAARTLLSQAASPGVQLRSADGSWRPEPTRMRIEIMASGPFESLRGIGVAVNQLQADLVTANCNGTIELRLTEVRPTCRHSTAWSGIPVDPGASTTAWECMIDEPGPSLTLFGQALRDSLRHHVNHIIMFGDRFDDGLLLLGSVVHAFQRGIRVSTLYLGDDFNGRNTYQFLAVSTGGLFMQLSDPGSVHAALPAIVAIACGHNNRLAAFSAGRTQPYRFRSPRTGFQHANESLAVAARAGRRVRRACHIVRSIL
jgi:hypothetical protein